MIWPVASFELAFAGELHAQAELLVFGHDVEGDQGVEGVLRPGLPGRRCRSVLLESSGVLIRTRAELRLGRAGRLLGREAQRFRRSRGEVGLRRPGLR